MLVSNDALVAYYEARARAEQRYALASETAACQQDGFREEIESQSQVLYQQRLGDLTNLMVGEVGVGNGDFVRHALAQKARTLVLMDISQDRLAALSEEFDVTASEGRIKCIVADAQCLDCVGDGELDLLVAKEVIEHLIDYRPFLRECHRVLRPGGRLYLTTPNRHCIDLWPRNALRHLVAPKKRQGSELIREVFGHLFDCLTAEEVDMLAAILPAGFKEHIYEFAPRELIGRLKDYGLQTVRRWGTPPQMFYHELRPVARLLLPGWTKAERMSYHLGDNLRLIAERIN